MIIKVLFYQSFKYLKLKKLIGFLHAFTRCDTTSCFFKQSKNKIIKTLLNGVVLWQKAYHFYNPTVNSDVLAASINDIVSRMYSREKSRKNDQNVINKCNYAKTIEYF